MRKVSLVTLFLFCIGSVWAQSNFNVSLVSHLPYNEDASDVWGWVDSTGREYAIVGVNTFTSIVSLEDPANPVELTRIPGARSIWRDMKSFGNYVYVVADQGADGVLVINMENAPDTVTWNFWQPQLDTLGINGPLERCHNLYIDENGYVYLSGCNVNNGGVIILDVFTVPAEPKLVGVCDTRYSHDNFTRGDTVWSGDILDGVFSAIDVSDKGNPVTLATQATSRNFAHNTWLSDDGKYLFTTDERPNANVDAYDVSDLDNIRRLDTYRPYENVDRGTIPHNTHYYKGYLVTAWYTDGLVITDVHRPENMVAVGIYDTYPGADGGYNGAWGAYPFLPSGLILISDIQTGLYVLQPEYKRAAYLEGKVTNSETGAAVIGAAIELPELEDAQTTTSFQGDYKTGSVNTGSFVVEVSHPEYEPTSATITLESGKVTIQDFQLVPKKKLVIGGNVKEEGFNNTFIPDAYVIVENEELRFETVTDLDGSFSLEVFEGEYDIYVAAWGYQHIFIEGQQLSTDERRLFELPSGYQDDFFADLGWTVNSDATAGIWERAEPDGTYSGATQFNPEHDVTQDIGDQCYVTGNDGRGDLGRDDVDNGETILSSPAMELSGYTNPILTYEYWFMTGGGRTAPNDTMKVLVTNGIGDTVVILEVFENTNGWKASPRDFDLSAYIELTDMVQIHFIASDDQLEGHLVEAGLDKFSVVEGRTTSVANEISELEFTAFPNPFEDDIILETGMESFDGKWQYEIIDVTGKVIKSGKVVSRRQTIQASELGNGLYFLRMKNENELTRVKPLVKGSR